MVGEIIQSGEYNGIYIRSGCSQMKRAPGGRRNGILCLLFKILYMYILSVGRWGEDEFDGKH